MNPLLKVVDEHQSRVWVWRGRRVSEKRWREFNLKSVKESVKRMREAGGHAKGRKGSINE